MNSIKTRGEKGKSKQMDPNCVSERLDANKVAMIVP
jgi:hypothetical protein